MAFFQTSGSTRPASTRLEGVRRRPASSGWSTATRSTRIEEGIEDKGTKFRVRAGEVGASISSPKHERYLTEEYASSVPVVVMNYPKDIKAFYMRLNDDGKTVAAMDVLAPGIGEIIGGSQREERLDVLDASASTETGLPKEGVLVVPRPPPLRHGPPRRLRPRLRAHDDLRHGDGERARRDSVPAHAEECRLLSLRRGYSGRRLIRTDTGRGPPAPAAHRSRRRCRCRRHPPGIPGTRRTRP